MSFPEFPKWPKTPRLSRDVAVTEKIDGTNGLIFIERAQFGAGIDGRTEDGRHVSVVIDFESPLGPDGLPDWEWHIRAGSRNRWISPTDDNHGFAKWVDANAVELAKLGPGRHYGEWFGQGIQRTYGLTEKRFALFNVSRWKDEITGWAWTEEPYPYEKAVQVPPVPGLTVVPLLMRGPGTMLSEITTVAILALEKAGSAAVRGFPQPEGVIVYHEGSGQYYKSFTAYGGK